MLRTSIQAIFCLVIASSPSWATSTVIDDFQDGTTQGWKHGSPSPNPPIQIPDGGPAGAGDGFLNVTSTGGLGAGSRLVVLNDTQWTGDFLNSNITAIAMDVMNPNRDALELRIALENVPLGGAFASTQGIPVAANSGWQTIVLPISPADLTDVGFAPLADTLVDVTRMRILHNSQPSRLGDVIEASLGIDNIRAVSVPEPGTILLLGICLSIAFVRPRST